MTSSELVERALRLVNPAPTEEQAVALRTALRVRMADALEIVGNRVAAGERHDGLKKDFDATPVAGVLDLTALTGLVLPLDIDKAKVRVAATQSQLHPIDDLLTLEYGSLPADAVYYALDGATLRIRSTTPSLTDYATALKLRANYIPSLTDATRPLRQPFEDMAVEALAGLVRDDK